MRIEQKTISISGFEVKEKKDGLRLIEGYASTFGNKDLVGDIVVKGAFSRSLEKRKVKMFLQHDATTLPGVWEECYEDEKGLRVQGRFIDTEDGRNAYVAVKEGAISEMSIGFGVRDYDYEDDIRILKEVELFEVSLVTFPANPKAVITNIKSFDSVKSIRDFEQFLREEGWSKNDAKIIASKGYKALEQREAVQLDNNADLLASAKELANMFKV